MIEFRPARPEDDAQLTRLVSQPMPGDLSLAFCREPSYLGSCAQYGPPRRVLTAVEGDRVVALCSFFLREYHWDGQPRAVWTLSDFRALSSKAGLSITGRGWKCLRGMLDGIPAVISVLHDNRRALRLFSKPRPGWPSLRPVGDLCTNITPLWRWPRSAQPSTVAPLERGQVLAFHAGHPEPLRPLLGESDFGTVLPPAQRFWGVFDDTGSLQGCAGLSEPAAFRQVKIHGYSGVYKWLRRLSLLPRVGSTVPLSFASLLHCRQPEAFRALFERLKSEARAAGSRFLVWCQGGPDLTAWWDRLRLRYKSRLFQVLWDGDPPLPPLRGPLSPEVAWL